MERGIIIIFLITPLAAFFFLLNYSKVKFSYIVRKYSSQDFLHWSNASEFEVK